MNKIRRKTYVKESPSILRTFFQHNKVGKKSVVLTDGGNAFFDEGKDVLLDQGFSMHGVYPAAVHQYLSQMIIVSMSLQSNLGRLMLMISPTI